MFHILQSTIRSLTLCITAPSLRLMFRGFVVSVVHAWCFVAEISLITTNLLLVVSAAFWSAWVCLMGGNVGWSTLHTLTESLQAAT
eukprot:51360-Rhodomonas_salina.1